MNRHDLFALEDLVQRQRAEAMKTQGLELVKLLRVRNAKLVQIQLSLIQKTKYQICKKLLL
jgi:hypothetical protein